ncbi:MAG: hypothetical protein DRQ44_04810 [Gammaproteobacteria bacterium]|nr:MAG: hypothetical protein DRQ44_04810 [Gammaproteobacteria bacterium]
MSHSSYFGLLSNIFITRRSVHLLLFLATFFAALVLNGCGGGGGSGPTGIPGMVVVVSDGPLAGSFLTVPDGALDSPVPITIKISDPANAAENPAANAEAEPEMHLAVVAYALNNLDDALMHPLYGPIFGLSSAAFAGPAVVLKPVGTVFNKPVTLTIPLDILGITDPTTAVPMLRNEDGSWQLLEDFTIDLDNGTATVSIPHFSLLQWLSNLVVAPQSATAVFAVGAVQNAMTNLPQDTIDQFMAAMACGLASSSTDLDSIPALPDLLDYLGFESIALTSGQEQPLVSWIKNQFQNARDNKIPFHSISLEELFSKAMSLNQGDIFKSLVTAHNALRDNRNSVSVQDMIENYRGDNGDERGARYHYFGMALYSFAYEHFMERARNRGLTGAQLVIGTTLRPEVVSTLEESIVSGDIISDVTEYAVDIQGAKLGRQLFRERNSTLNGLAGRYGVDVTQCDDIAFTLFSGLNFDGSFVLDPADADIQLSSNIGNPIISWGNRSATNIAVLDNSNVRGPGDAPELIYCINAAEDQDTGLDIPFTSPVTYGDYGVNDTTACGGIDSPSPVLKTNHTYQFVVVPAIGVNGAMVLFLIP